MSTAVVDDVGELRTCEICYQDFRTTRGRTRCYDPECHAEHLRRQAANWRHRPHYRPTPNADNARLTAYLLTLTPGELAAYVQGRLEAACDGNDPTALDRLRQVVGLLDRQSRAR